MRNDAHCYVCYRNMITQQIFVEDVLSGKCGTLLYSINYMDKN